MHKVGDIHRGIKTGYPHLDAVGDVGTFAEEDGVPLARYVVVAVYPDPKTNEVLTKDVQLVKSLDLSRVVDDRDARCAIHNTPIHSDLPCPECQALEVNNYPLYDPVRMKQAMLEHLHKKS